MSHPTRPSPNQPRGWHSRGYLRHFDAGDEYTQFITFRLADSLPAAVMARLQQTLQTQPQPIRDQELHRLIEEYLDAGHGSSCLRDPRIGELIEGALLHFDADRYFLHGWVIMPNHVHAVLTPTTSYSLSKIVGAWKSFTSKQANILLGRCGQFWQEDYFDRYVRNDHHFSDTLEYVETNPVAAGLCSKPEDWLFGSARRRAGHAAETAALQKGNAS